MKHRETLKEVLNPLGIDGYKRNKRGSWKLKVLLLTKPQLLICEEKVVEICQNMEQKNKKRGGGRKIP